MPSSMVGPERRPDFLLGAAVGVGMLVSVICMVAWKLLERQQLHDAAATVVLFLGIWAVAAPVFVALAAMPRMFALRRELLQLKQGNSAEPGAAP